MNDNNFKNKKPFYGNKGGNNKKGFVSKFTLVAFKLGESEKYDSTKFDSLVDIISKCSFDACAITAKMAKTLFFGSDDAKGTVDIGEIKSYDADTKEFTVSMPTNTYEKIKPFVDNNDLVMVPNIRFDRETKEVNFISAFVLAEGNAFVPVK